MAKVSIIIPVYNAEKYIKECLDSVINQTLKDIEIICVDDKSTDSSLSILKGYAQKDNRFIIIEQNENKGAGISRNTAIDIARGEYLSFVDPDDYISENMYAELYEQAQKLDSEIILFNYYTIDEQLNKSKSHNWYKLLNNTDREIVQFPEGQNIDKLLIYQTALVSSGFSWLKFYKTKFIKENKIYFSEQRCYEDNILTLASYIRANKISYNSKAYYYYRKHNSSLSHKLVREHMFYLINTAKEIYKFLNLNNLMPIFKNNFNYRLMTDASYVYNSLESEIDKKYLRSNLKHLLEKYYYKILVGSQKTKYIQKIFSIRNSDDKTHKIIVILGIRLKFKSKKLIRRQQGVPEMEYSFAERIFSVKNCDVRKVITILGMKYRIKSKKLIERKRIENLGNESLTPNSKI